MKIVKKILKKLVDKKYKISFAESMTGGGLAYELVKQSGASKVLSESFVTYSNLSKENILNVSKETIKEYGIVSKEVSVEMARGLKEKTNSNIAVSITGNAGPLLQDGTFMLESYITIILEDNIFTYNFIYKNNHRKKILHKTVKLFYKTLYNLLDC